MKSSVFVVNRNSRGSSLLPGPSYAEDTYCVWNALSTHPPPPPAWLNIILQISDQMLLPYRSLPTLVQSKLDSPNSYSPHEICLSFLMSCLMCVSVVPFSAASGQGCVCFIHQCVHTVEPHLFVECMSE